MSNRSNDRLRSVATVALGPDGLALSTIRDPPFSITNDGTVFLFRSQNTNQGNANSNNNNNNNMEMGLFQKLSWDACDLFGDVAQFLEDGSLLVSCWKSIAAEDNENDGGDGDSDSAATSKVSILYFTNMDGSYVFRQEFVMDNDVAVSDLDSRWFTVDREQGVVLVRERSGAVRVYGRMGGVEDPWQVYSEATFVGDGDGAANVGDNDDVSGGEMAVSGNSVFMQMGGDLQVFQLDEC